MDNNDIKSLTMLSAEAHKNGEYVNELFYLYHCLRKAETIQLKESIDRLRRIAFYLLNLHDLALLITRTSSALDVIFPDDSDTFFLRSLAPEALIEKYQLCLLYNYEESKLSSTTIPDLLDLLIEQKRASEYIFWIDYLLLFDSENSDLRFRKSVLFFSLGEFLESYTTIKNISDREDIDFHKGMCLNKLNRFDDVLALLYESTALSEIQKHLLKLHALSGKFTNDPTIEAEFKKVYIEGMRLYLEISEDICKRHSNYTYHILNNSPYCIKFFKLIETEGLIYHYTDGYGIKGIIENKEFWATKCDFLNDYKEQRFIVNILQSLNNFPVNFEKSTIIDALNRYFCSVENNERPDCNAMDDFIDNYIIQSTLSEAYILSFSTEDDNLTLWSNYSSGLGYSIGITSEELLNNLVQKSDVQGGKITYISEHSESNIISDIISEIFNDLSDSDIKKDLINKTIIAHLILFCNFIKHDSMNPENEYRIILIRKTPEYSSYLNDEISKPLIRLKQNSPIPFVKLKYADYDAIKSITIGPINKADISEKGIRYLLKTKSGTSHIHVKKSDIPLRY